MPKSRKSHTPKARPKQPVSGEWVTDELPSAVLARAMQIRVPTGRSHRKPSNDALRKIGEAFSFYRQTSAPPPPLDVAKASELREVIADLFARIDNIDDGLALALAVAWHRLRYDGRPFAAPDVSADSSQFAQNRALLTRLLLPEIEFPPPASAGSFDGWPAARQWLHVLDAGLREVIESAPAANQGGRPRAVARDRLLASVAQALTDDGLPPTQARVDAAALIAEAKIQLPKTTRQVRAAAKRGG
jgi:hypothetical protein